MRNCSRVIQHSSAEKNTEKVELEAAKLQERRGKFIYFPSRNTDEYVKNMQAKSTDEYLNIVRPGLNMTKPIYVREEMIYDPESKRWKLVPETEL